MSINKNPPCSPSFQRDLLALIPHLRAFARKLCGHRELADRTLRSGSPLAPRLTRTHVREAVDLGPEHVTHDVVLGGQERLVERRALSGHLDEEIGERLRSGEAAQTEVDLLAARVAISENEARAVREHMAVLDQRVTNVGTELANQLSELGRDIDGLAQRVPDGADAAVSDEVVDELRDSQVKLANEQARYEIAFRQDLAALAEQLRRARDDD